MDPMMLMALAQLSGGAGAPSPQAGQASPAGGMLKGLGGAMPSSNQQQAIQNPFPQTQFNALKQLGG